MDLLWAGLGGLVAGYLLALPVLLSLYIAYGVTENNTGRPRFELAGIRSLLCGAIYLFLKHSENRLGDFGAQHLFDFTLAATFVAAITVMGMTAVRRSASIGLRPKARSWRKSHFNWWKSPR